MTDATRKQAAATDIPGPVEWGFGKDVIGAAIGSVVVPVLLGWTLLLLYTRGIHYILSGSLALVDEHFCFIRFRLRKQAENSAKLGGDGERPKPVARLIDVFQVRG